MSNNAKMSLLGGIGEAAQAAPVRETKAPSMPPLHIENQALKAKIKELEGSGSSEIFKLSPGEIIVHPWTNRSADSFRVKDFDDLRQMIADAGHNVVPIVVHKVGGKWHLICGRRRVQACKELGFEVNAVAWRDDLDDLGVFAMMHAENQGRTKPTLYEIGHSIEAFLKDQAAKTGKDAEEIVSLRDLGKIVGLSHTSVRLARQAVALPDDVTLCIDNLTLLTAGNIQALLTALAADKDAVLARAKAIIEGGDPLPAAQAVQQLCHDGGIDGAEPEKPLHTAKDHKPFAKVKKDAKGAYTLSFVPGFKRDHMEKLKQLATELAKENEGLIKSLAPKPKAKKKATAAKKKPAKAKAPAKDKKAAVAVQGSAQEA